MADTTVVGPLARIEPQLATGAIANERFIRQLDELRTLKQFLFEEKVQFKEEDLESINFAELNNLSYSSRGRVPSIDEWRKLDEKLAKLTSYLGDDLRKKIRIRELGMFFSILPIIFLSITVVSIILYNNLIILHSGSSANHIVWLIIMSTYTISQGGLGACAFLGTSVITKTSILNQISPQANPTTQENSTPRENVDLTDYNFLIIRVILGTSFAVILGLPYSTIGLNIFSDLYWQGNPVTTETVILSLIPFLAGFSTNLVLVILGKFVLAIEAVFGSSGRA